MKLRMQAISMLSKKTKGLLDRLTTPVFGEGYDDSLLKVIDGRTPAEYKKLRKMDEINSVKGQYDT